MEAVITISKFFFELARFEFLAVEMFIENSTWMLLSTWLTEYIP